MVGEVVVDDPWAEDGPPIPRRAPSARWRAVAAWAVSLGVVAQVWIFGGQQWSQVVGGAAIAAVGEVVLRWRRGRGPAWTALRTVGLGAVAGLAVVVLGPTPGILLVAVLVVADAALVAWCPLRGWPSRRTEVVPLAVGLLVGAQVLWCRGGSVGAVLGLLAAAGILVEAAGRAPDASEAVNSAVRRTIRAVVDALVAVALFAICALLVYLPGFVHRMAVAPARRARRRGQHSMWITRTATVADARRDVLRPFVTTDRHLRNRRTASGLAVVAVVAVLATLWVRSQTPDPGPAGAPTDVATVSPGAGTGATTPPEGRHIFATELDGAYSSLPAYTGVSFADALQQEEIERVVSANFEGTYLNVRDGYRATLQPESCDCPTARLWFSGGSAAFGTGQRDDHTVSSELVRLAAERDGIRLEVENVSHDGYTFQMEWEWEVEQRLRTEEAPDLLVFYNGWNDVMAEVSATFLEGADPDRELSIIVPNDLAAVNDRTDEFLASGIGVDSGLRAADRYRRVQAEVDAAARRDGVEVAYFFQPDALVSARQIDSYEQLTGLSSDEMLTSPLASGAATMADDLGRQVQDLRPLFADVDDPSFLGLVHQPESAAAVAAAEIYQRLRADIVELAR